MKKNLIIFISAFLLFIGGCDKDFVEINTNPFAINDIDPSLLFADAQRTPIGGWESEHTVVQHFVNPFNDGATLAFNFNANIDGFQNGSWGQYTGAVKTLVHVLHLLEETTDRVNLQSMARIWKAQVFMDLVDHYGDVPYFKAGRAAIEGETAFFNSYDDDAAIYDDLYNEITEALSALNPDGDFVSADLFYGAHAYYPTGSAAEQVAKWNKLGNSLLLRLGMRYSKANPARAATIVSEAFNGGVMTANTDNAFVTYDGTLFINNSNNGLINNNPRFYYAAEPFVNNLKTNNDPRGKYMFATYADPNNPLGDPNPNTTLSAQFGLPVGVIGGQLTIANGHRGPKGSGFNYSQMNVRVLASISAPTFWVTYAQTSLLLAEAAIRNWIPGGAAASQQYYEAGIRADMSNYALYLSETASSMLPVSVAEQDAYLAQPGVAFNTTNALALINTQYWIVTISNGSESWANFRRSGLPALNRNPYDNALLANGGDGFVHRFTYPDAELSRNKANYDAAVTTIGGTDNLQTRVFWDIP